MDLIHDEARGKISCYARDNHVLIMQGPFQILDISTAYPRQVLLGKKHMRLWIVQAEVSVLRFPIHLKSAAVFGSLKLCRRTAGWKKAIYIVFLAVDCW